MIGVTDDKKMKNMVLNISLVVTIALVYILPIDFIQNNETIFPSGPAIIVTYSYCFIFMMFQLYLCLKYRKTISTKKFTPFYSFLLLGGLNFVITLFFPGLFLVGYLFCLSIIIMYFTIENPDVKMLEEATLAREQADKANHAKSDFLSSMSHEIRTPLNAIVGLSEDILEMEDLPPAAKEDADDIVMASQTLLEIVGNILDISKIESEKLEITESEYNPREIFENLARIDAVRIGEKPIDFKLHIAEDLPFELIGDKVHVKQVVNNLISNSIKYTNEGEINLTINCINKGSQCDLIITCQDTGIGIKKEYIDKLFGKFERLGVEK